MSGPVRVLLMDRVPGQQGLALADPADRERLLFECIDHMAAMHRIPMEEVARRGILVPAEPGDVVVSDVFRRVERRYLDAPVPRAWAERRVNLVHWSEPARGGHHSSWEVPEIFVEDVRAFVKRLG